MVDRSNKPNFFQVITLLCYLARSARIPDDDDDVSDSVFSYESQSLDVKSSSPASSLKSPFISTLHFQWANITFTNYLKVRRKDIIQQGFFTRLLAEKEACTLLNRSKEMMV